MRRQRAVVVEADNLEEPEARREHNQWAAAEYRPWWAASYVGVGIEQKESELEYRLVEHDRQPLGVVAPRRPCEHCLPPSSLLSTLCVFL